MKASAQLLSVSKKFGQVTALQEISLTVQPGEFIALLGPSGCGKTTLLRLLAGFEQPTTGEIWLNDRQVATPSLLLPPEKRRIGMVFQSFALWPHMTVQENVMFPLKYQADIPPEFERNPQKRVAEVLEMVGLAGYEQRYPSQLSGGQRQRVALARALVFAPAILLMDEPLSSLDAELRVQMRREIQEIHQQLGTTIVYVTHDQAEALAMADRIVVMKQGHIEQIGTPEEIYAAPQTAFVAKFVGRANFLPGVWLDPHHFSISYTPESRVIVKTSRHAEEFHQRGILPLRPEQLTLMKPTGAADGLLGTVEHIQYQGKEMVYTVRIGNDQVEVLQYMGQPVFQRNEQVTLQIQP